MKTLNVIVNIIVLLLFAYILTIFILFFTVKPTTSTDIGTSYSYSIEPDPDSAFIDNLSRDLPYHVYRHLADSARQADRNIRMANDELAGSINVLGIGLYDMANRNCTTPDQIFTTIPPEQHAYYIGVGNYTLTNNHIHTPPVYFRKNQKNYLKYYDTVSVNKRNIARPYIKELPFRYYGSQILAIRVSKTTYQVCRVVLNILFIAAIGAGLWALRCLMKLGLSIAAGVFFTVKNKKRLATVAIILFISALIPLMVRLISWPLLYRSTHKDFSTTLTSLNEIKWLLLALFMWLLSKAFNRGLQLQQEQDLTV